MRASDHKLWPEVARSRKGTGRFLGMSCPTIPWQACQGFFAFWAQATSRSANDPARVKTHSDTAST